MSTHKEYVEILKKTALQVGKKALLDVVIKKLPFLMWGPLGPITSFLLGKVVEVLITQTEFAIFFAYIDFRVDRQASVFSQAAIENHRVQQTGSEDEKRKSEKALMAAFKNFVTFTS